MYKNNLNLTLLPIFPECAAMIFEFFKSYDVETTQFEQNP